MEAVSWGRTAERKGFESPRGVPGTFLTSVKAIHVWTCPSPLPYCRNNGQQSPNVQWSAHFSSQRKQLQQKLWKVFFTVQVANDRPAWRSRRQLPFLPRHQFVDQDQRHSGCSNDDCCLVILENISKIQVHFLYIWWFFFYLKRQRSGPRIFSKSCTCEQSSARISCFGWKAGISSEWRSDLFFYEGFWVRPENVSSLLTIVARKASSFCCVSFMVRWFPIFSPVILVVWQSQVLV